MALYDYWDESFQEVWESTPGTAFLDDQENNIAQDLFNLGFIENVHGYRDEFFDYMEMPEDMFPWAEWREAMGYD